MNARIIEEQLAEVLNDDAGQEILPLTAINTFEDAGVLTHNRGLVIRTRSGEEFQITIVQSR